MSFKLQFVEEGEDPSSYTDNSDDGNLFVISQPDVKTQMCKVSHCGKSAEVPFHELKEQVDAAPSWEELEKEIRSWII